jgi:hypothetical protein
MISIFEQNHHEINVNHEEKNFKGLQQLISHKYFENKGEKIECGSAMTTFLG